MGSNKSLPSLQDEEATLATSRLNPLETSPWILEASWPPFLSCLLLLHDGGARTEGQVTTACDGRNRRSHLCWRNGDASLAGFAGGGRRRQPRKRMTAR